MSRRFSHRIYSRGEEIAHSITHGIGALLSIAGLVVMVVSSARHGDAWSVVAAAVYGTSMVLLYTASTLYHALTPPRAKRVFQVLDHAAIYLLIAGTYTPFSLVSMRGGWGWTIFGLVWGIAIAGIVFEAALGNRFRKLSLACYLGLGWLAVIAVKPLLATVPATGLWLLLAGGLCYSGGVVFYTRRGLPYHHAVWHVFVLGGSVCHFFAVLGYVLP